MKKRKYQVRFVPSDLDLQDTSAVQVESGSDALRTAKDLQDHFNDLGEEDAVPVKWIGIIATMKPWYLDTGHTFVLIEWRDGSKLIMEPVR